MSTIIPPAKNYASRMRDLTEFAQSEYKVDPMEMRIIAAALLPTPKLDPPHPAWLIIDTERTEFIKQLSLSVFQINMQEVECTHDMRAVRPRYSNPKIERI